VRDATTIIGLAAAFAVLGYLNIQDFHRYEDRLVEGEERATEGRSANKETLQDAQHCVEELTHRIEEELKQDAHRI
jgi:hypothetical protein